MKIKSWSRGEEIAYNGQHKILHGGLFWWAEILTGHQKGEMTWISDRQIKSYNPELHEELTNGCRRLHSDMAR
jgi:hypothetical protein